MPKRPDPYLIDDDNPELTREQIRAMRPASEVLPPELYANLVKDYEARQAQRKQAVKIDLDRDVVAKLKAYGEGWQARANEMLRKAVGLT